MFQSLKNFIEYHFFGRRKIINSIRKNNYFNWRELYESYNKNAAWKIDPKSMKNFGLELYRHHVNIASQYHHFTEEEEYVLNDIKEFFDLNEDRLKYINKKIGKEIIESFVKNDLKDRVITEEEENVLKDIAQYFQIQNEDIDTIERKNSLELYNRPVAKLGK